MGNKKNQDNGMKVCYVMTGSGLTMGFEFAFDDGREFSLITHSFMKHTVKFIEGGMKFDNGVKVDRYTGKTMFEYVFHNESFTMKDFVMDICNYKNVDGYDKLDDEVKEAIGKFFNEGDMGEAIKYRAGIDGNRKAIVKFIGKDHDCEFDPFNHKAYRFRNEMLYLATHRVEMKKMSRLLMEIFVEGVPTGEYDGVWVEDKDLSTDLGHEPKNECGDCVYCMCFDDGKLKCTSANGCQYKPLEAVNG